MKPSEFLAEREYILKALTYTVKDLQRYIAADPAEYMEFGCDEPSIDVRLCVDDDGWIIRTGSSDFDPYHSKYCAGSSVGLYTETEELLEDLIGQILDQAAAA